MAAVPPLGVPQVISLAFWGGLWAIAMAYAFKDLSGGSYWLWWTVIGAIAPSIVALFVVFPLKGMPMAGGWDPKLIIGALLLNGAWGFGTALFLRYLPRFN
jgi:FtsH-binding integral membrane protein